MTHNTAIERFTNRIVVDGRRVTIRPICGEDIARERAFVLDRSPASRYFHFLGGVQQFSAAAKSSCEIDFDTKMAFVALCNDISGNQHEIGVSRYATDSVGECEFALTVADEWQHHGLGHHLMDILIGFARDKGKKKLYSLDLESDTPMRELANELGMSRTRDVSDTALVRHELILAQ